MLTLFDLIQLQRKYYIYETKTKKIATIADSDLNSSLLF